jgi:hypothetical protein
MEEEGKGGRQRRKVKVEGKGHRPWDHSLAIVGRKHQGGEPKARTGTQEPEERDGGN